MENVRDGGHQIPSWAFAGLHLLSRSTEPELDRREIILLGSAHLLGLLIDEAQMRRDSWEERVKRAENELTQMRLIRAEDAKANEKVVGIFASHEQSWIAERKSLRLQIRALTAQLQSLRAKNEETVSNLSYRLTEAECEIKAKDEIITTETKKKEELLEKLRVTEKEVQELKEEFEKEERDHRSAMEMSKRELDRTLERKEEAGVMVERLSDKIGKLRGDLDQKDKMLSAMLRKSKLDAEEKGMLLKEVQMSKAKKKQAELEMEKWRNKWELRHKKGSRASMEAAAAAESSKSILLDYFDSERQKEQRLAAEGKAATVVAAVKCLDQYSSEGLNDDIHDFQNLKDWVRMETEKYATILEQKHFTEIEAFTEQMRLKDEKIEAFRWRLLSRDIESKRLQSQIEVLEENLSQLREDNFKLGALLMDKEEEIKSLKEELSSFVHYYQRNSLKNYPTSQVCEALTEVVTTMKKQRNMEVDSEVVNDIAAVSPTDSALSADNSVDNSIICIDEITSKEALSLDSYEHAKSISLIIDSSKEETEEEKVVSIDSIHASSVNNTHKRYHAFTKESSSRMDIQALGVSYKIKRLKQQLLMLEKLAGVKQIMIGDHPCASPKDKKIEDNKQHLKGITLVIYLLSKQVKRFQSLEEKANDLCRRMHENTGGGSGKEQSRVLGNFLEETFQLQRLMVATGQKLMDIQLKIMSSINSSDGGLDESVGFNMEQFAYVIGTLFRDIQRGLEVRIARIIGDLEGTLACDGIRHI